MSLSKAEWRYLTGASDDCPESMSQTRPKVWAEFVATQGAFRGEEPVVLPKEHEAESALPEESVDDLTESE